MTIKLLIVDDHKIMREGLRTILEQENEFTTIGEAANGREALNIIKEKVPDIVIMDINMPEMNGMETTRRIKANFPKTKVIALSMHSDRFYVAEMLKAGVSGYLLKDCSTKDIIDAVHNVSKNRSYLSPEITGVVINDFIEQNQTDHCTGVSHLTEKEREVLQLIAEGCTSKIIAANLNIAVKTVESHRINIMKKLDIHSIANLTKFAVRHGITCLEK